jgi:S-adenosylmethionine hydrolase
VTNYYRYIDCDKIIFENPSSQIPQVTRFTYTNNDVGINENLDYFRQLDCTHIDGYTKQSKIIRTYTDSRVNNSLCEPGNLENLGISVNLDSKTNIQMMQI